MLVISELAFTREREKHESKAIRKGEQCLISHDQQTRLRFACEQSFRLIQSVQINPKFPP